MMRARRPAAGILRPADHRGERRVDHRQAHAVAPAACLQHPAEPRIGKRRQPPRVRGAVFPQPCLLARELQVLDGDAVAPAARQQAQGPHGVADHHRGAARVGAGLGEGQPEAAHRVAAAVGQRHGEVVHVEVHRDHTVAHVGKLPTVATPRTDDTAARLDRALLVLKQALARQQEAVQAWRQNLERLAGSVGSLAKSLHALNSGLESASERLRPEPEDQATVEP